MVERKTIAQLIHEDTGVFDLLPDNMEAVTQMDAEYHGDVRDQWVELNQIQTERNRRFHNAVITELSADLSGAAVILELGSGVGYDAGRFLERHIPFGCYIVSEIAVRLLEYSKQLLAPISVGRQVLYCALDANDLLIADDQIDCIVTIAALHHFPNLGKALAEMDRVTKPRAKLIFAMEPNRLWSTILVALRPLYRRLFSSKTHSAADEEAEGFTLKDLKTMGKEFHWKVHSVTPIWFFTGALHSGLEFVARLLRLKRRLVVPIFVERAFLATDAVFLRIPFCDRLAWHYTVVLRK